MVRFVLTILVVLIVQVAAADEPQPSGSENIATAERFMETVVTDPIEAKSLTHEKFEFMFMGRTRISNVPYDRTSYFDTWLPEVVAKLVPFGFRRLEVVDAIGDAEGVALIVEGDADGVNGLYDNRYVFIFKFKGGKIASLREYNSDLLVATRLFKQRLVTDD